MCDVEDAMKTVGGSVLVSKSVYKKLVEEYEKQHGEEETIRMIDDEGHYGCATEGEILILLDVLKMNANKSYIEWHYIKNEDLPKERTKVVILTEKNETHIWWLDSQHEWHDDEEDYDEYEDFVGYDLDVVKAWYYPQMV